MSPATHSHYGIVAALAEIARRNRSAFDEAEERLREKMKPARLAPFDADRSSQPLHRSTPQH